MYQKPGPDGVRRSRWAIIRNSYPELKTTTLKTWTQWVPGHFGRLTMDSPIRHHIKTKEHDIEVLFVALDKPDDVKKLLSMELTGAWVNEAREVPKAIIDALTGRVGRFPARNMGGCTWSGILMDTNPPDDQSWWYDASEKEVPDGWVFFKQPSGRSPEAENLQNLPENYYTRMMAGKDADWIRVYVDGEYGLVTEGKPVFPMYRDSVHASAEVLEPAPELPLFIGADFGLTPAAVIGQKLVDGRWRILKEFVTEDTGLIRFAEELHSFVKRTFPDNIVEACWGDPAGNVRGGHDERTGFEIMRTYTGWKWKAAPGENEIDIRFEVVKNALNRMIDGQPGFLLSRDCAVLRKSFAGGYHYKFLKGGDGTQVVERPTKNKYSHPSEAVQYLLLGGGEIHIALRKRKPSTRPGHRTGAIEAQDMDYKILG